MIYAAGLQGIQAWHPGTDRGLHSHHQVPVTPGVDKLLGWRTTAGVRQVPPSRGNVRKLLLNPDPAMHGAGSGDVAAVASTLPPTFFFRLIRVRSITT